jgi:CheY-like chemotaxis protein
MSDISILVVDDDPAIRRLFNGILQKRNYEVYTARDGAEAIELLGQKDYAVVMLDLHMPNINGEDVLNYLRANSPHYLPRVVVVSAAGERAMNKMDLRGVHTVMEKPFDLGTLADTIYTMVGEYISASNPHS